MTFYDFVHKKLDNTVKKSAEKTQNFKARNFSKKFVLILHV